MLPLHSGHCFPAVQRHFPFTRSCLLVISLISWGNRVTEKIMSMPVLWRFFSRFSISFLSLTFYLGIHIFWAYGPLAFGQASIPSVQQHISPPIPNSIAVTCSPFWKQLQMDPRTKWQWNAILFFSLSITHFSYCHLLKTFSLLKWVFLVSLVKKSVDVAVGFFLIIMIFVSFF